MTQNTLPNDIKVQECDATMLLWNTNARTKILIIDQRSTTDYPTTREAGFTTFQEGTPAPSIMLTSSILTIRLC